MALTRVLGAAGQYLYIQIPGDNKLLSLCEVKVLGEEVTPEEGGYDPLGLAWQEEPRPDQLPMGSSRYFSILLLYLYKKVQTLMHKGAC